MEPRLYTAVLNYKCLKLPQQA